MLVSRVFKVIFKSVSRVIAATRTYGGLVFVNSCFDVFLDDGVHDVVLNLSSILS